MKKLFTAIALGLMCAFTVPAAAAVYDPYSYEGAPYHETYHEEETSPWKTLGIIAIALLVDAGFCYIITNVADENTHGKVDRMQIFWVSFLFTPVAGLLVALLSSLNYVPKENIETTSRTIETPDGMVWVVNSTDKRIKIYESELQSYLDLGWKKLID